MSIYLYSTKLFRNNSAAFLHLHKPLNYKLSLMRNDYILKITLSLSLRNRHNKKKRLRGERGVIEH